jgi:23S rRNA pseudouridine1911/1915/1917 synthase
MKPEENDLFIVTEDEAGERLDKLLARRFGEVYSRTYFQHLIEQELVWVNGLPIKKRAKPIEGDEIEVQFAITPEIDLTPENIPLSILYEDDTLIIINKPVGMVVHPAPGNWSGTFVNALLYYCGQLSVTDESLRPGIVHRLDKETSGILMAAKTLEMQQKLSELFANRQVYKEYLAICLGKLDDGKIQAPIGRHPIHRKQMAIVPTGKPAISIFKTLGTNEKLSLVRVVIETGRTHQIRVHLKYQGAPILGDPLYGNSSSNRFYKVERQLLHASILRFIHPLTKQELTIEAPLPLDMERIIRKFKLSNSK